MPSATDVVITLRWFDMLVSREACIQLANLDVAALFYIKAGPGTESGGQLGEPLSPTTRSSRFFQLDA
ncbi:hypothetical protein QC763_0016210 [Podospora pseudopauciseta]|uniref:Uncharacterized protein n=1 Tax=Podospora pseudopauciseta TaxID=2093780 RepID=A0ABR0HZX4_9PEZI|nr:hypothetical protein QC763_0016210 [Podospora pseudopauciseta]